MLSVWPYEKAPDKAIRREDLEDAVSWRLDWYKNDGSTNKYAESDDWVHWLLRIVVASEDDPYFRFRFIQKEKELYGRRFFCKDFSRLWFCLDKTFKLARALNCKPVVGRRLNVNSLHFLKAKTRLKNIQIFSLPVFARHRRIGENLHPNEMKAMIPGLRSGQDLEFCQHLYQKDCYSLLETGQCLLINGELFFSGTMQNLSLIAKDRFVWKLQESLLFSTEQYAYRPNSVFQDYINTIKPHLRAALGLGTIFTQETRIRQSSFITAAEFDALLFPGLVSLSGPSRLPPCMAFMHFKLRTKHHLHYLARLQYAFFLKHIISPKEALILFASEFTKSHIVRKSTWARKYKAQLTSQLNSHYSCFGCTKLATHRIPNRSAEQYDGCPFAFDHPHLLNPLLKRMAGTATSSIITAHSSPQERCHAAFIDIHHAFTPTKHTSNHSKKKKNRITLGYETDHDHAPSKPVDESSRTLQIRGPLDWFERSCAVFPLRTV